MTNDALVDTPPKATTKREYLKGRFKQGMIPSENDFSELIDSFVALSDDGVTFTAQGDEGVLLNFVRETPEKSHAWQFRIKKDGTFVICNMENPDFCYLRLSLKSKTEGLVLHVQGDIEGSIDK